MERFINKLREKGYKITPQRRGVIMALMRSTRFVTAQQVFDYVRDRVPDVSFDTVYRNLALLVEIGVVNEVKMRGREGNLYEISYEGHHHHHLVCLGCGKAECLDFCPVDNEHLTKAEKNGFKVTWHALEFYGYCPNCR